MSKNAEQMPNGIYENLVTASLQHALAHRADVVFTGENENDLAVIRGAAEIHMLSAIKQSIQKATSPEEIATTVSKVLQAVNMEDLPASPARALLSVGDFNNAPALRKRPYTSLLRQALITNDAANPNLAAELSREFATADAVDILISFVMSSGIHVLRPALHDLATRKVPIRVVTTSYIGATETKAIRMLIEEFGAQVRVDLDGDSQRLHAKAWIIHRNTNLSTAFVGSSNISSPAMLNGREWNIRLSQKADSTLFNKLSATFETYWNSPSFHALSNDEDFVQLERALARYKHNANTNNIPLFNLEPKPHQMRMLEELAIARDVYDRHWNLVVAATGTGKTVLAALDYARACKESKRRPRLLFVAHRREILNQARHTFRNALADGSFGELWTGTDKPESNQHLFANIQTINNELKNKPDALATFEWVVVDEFHHAAAATYRTMMNSLEPVELVGLTATPERTDQIAVQDEFFDGVITSELRIWDALDLDLLSPFTYFGIGDSTDISKVAWQKGRYNSAELSQTLITNADLRNRLLLRELHSKIPDVANMKALIFCASVEHAIHVSNFLNQNQIMSRSVDASTPQEDRQAVLNELSNGTIQAICSVDVFGEGIDIPAVDTIVMLRPTESPLVFLQQLGRGLRKHPSKTGTIVLDFVMANRTEYRMDLRLEALTGLQRDQIIKAVENGFPYLPSGCNVSLDQLANEHIIANLRSQIGKRGKLRIIEDIKQFSTTDLNRFLYLAQRPMSEVLKSASWLELLIAAGLHAPASEGIDLKILERARNFAYASDILRQDVYRRCISDNPPNWSTSSVLEKRLIAMFVWNLFPEFENKDLDSYEKVLAWVHSNEMLREELLQVLDHVKNRMEHLPQAMPADFADIPLLGHAQYTRYEILAAIDYAKFEKNAMNHSKNSTIPARTHREGVCAVPELGIDALFVTLHKKSADTSPADFFEDYAIAPNMFHWESQPQTSIDSPTGKRYASQQTSKNRMFLFLRGNERSELGSSPFIFLGPAKAADLTGSKPIRMKLELDFEMPIDIYSESTITKIA